LKTFVTLDIIIFTLNSFYPNVTTLHSGLSYRNPSVICLSVTIVHPTQGVEAFGNISSPLCTLATSDLRAKFYGDVSEEPLCQGH